MASLALPRFSLPSLPRLSIGGLAAMPQIRVGAAAVGLMIAAIALFGVVRPRVANTALVKAPLAATLRNAPKGWREALSPLSGPVRVTRDVIRLSERPLPPITATAWNRPGAALPPFQPGQPLPPAPIAGLFAPGPGGPTPIIGADGRTPFDAYRRPFVANGRPKIALVIGGLGLNSRTTQQAIETLPAEITLSFSPYAEGLQGWIDMARARGHEVLLEAPMEPVDFPDNDPGSLTLMSTASGPDTVHRLEAILSKCAGYFGVRNALGSRFMVSEWPFQAFGTALKGRGLAFVDDGSATKRPAGVARASIERIVDDQLNPGAIDQQLLALEAGALQRGAALGAGSAYGVTLEKAAQWSRGVEQRGFQLAPASALTHP